jgi:hypothetical protein
VYVESSILCEWACILCRCVVSFGAGDMKGYGWEASEAKAFCDALRCALISALPGYDAAERSID